MTGAPSPRPNPSAVLCQITDTHISVNAGPRSWLQARLGLQAATYPTLAELATSAKQVASRAPLVRFIVSGDLTVRGGYEELDNALAYIRSQHAWAHSGAGIPNSRLDWVLGNHDMLFGSVPRFFIGRVGRDELTGFRRHYGKDNVISSRLSTKGLDIEIYQLDSATTGGRNKLARGEVNETQLEQLDALVANSASTKPLLRVLVLHHPPKQHFKLLPYASKLTGARNVRRDIDRHQIGLVLAGHTHEERIDVFGASGGSVQGVGGSTCLTDPRPQMLLYDLYDPPNAQAAHAEVTIRRWTTGHQPESILGTYRPRLVA